MSVIFNTTFYSRVTEVQPTQSNYLLLLQAKLNKFRQWLPDCLAIALRFKHAKFCSSEGKPRQVWSPCMVRSMQNLWPFTGSVKNLFAGCRGLMEGESPIKIHDRRSFLLWEVGYEWVVTCTMATPVASGCQNFWRLQLVELTVAMCPHSAFDVCHGKPQV